MDLSSFRSLSDLCGLCRLALDPRDIAPYGIDSIDQKGIHVKLSSWLEGFSFFSLVDSCFRGGRRRA